MALFKKKRVQAQPESGASVIPPLLKEAAWSNPRGLAETALAGSQTRKRLIQLIERTEAEINQHAIGYAEREGPLMVHPKLMSVIRGEHDGSVLEPDLYLAFPTHDSQRRTNDEWASVVKRYSARTNDTSILTEKAAILAAFVTNNTYTGLTLCDEILSTAPDLTEQQEYSVRMEEVACWRSIVIVGARQQIESYAPLFLAHFVGQCAYIMTLQGGLPNTLFALLVKRETEYARYADGIRQGEDSDSLGTLVRQAAKHVGDACGEGRNPVFLSAFQERLLERVDAASIRGLLKGPSV